MAGWCNSNPYPTDSDIEKEDDICQRFGNGLADAERGLAASPPPHDYCTVMMHACSKQWCCNIRAMDHFIIEGNQILCMPPAYVLVLYSCRLMVHPPPLALHALLLRCLIGGL